MPISSAQHGAQTYKCGGVCEGLAWTVLQDPTQTNGAQLCRAEGMQEVATPDLSTSWLSCLPQTLLPGLLQQAKDRVTAYAGGPGLP